MEYNFTEIESRWQNQWEKDKQYKVENTSNKPPYYVLDMFPYPSGAGLHVGHPLGYIASDIYSRYKHLKGFNVLHPMGFDAFGLPAEQYAIQTGQHPQVTTEKNIARYINQLKKIGFCYDWDRMVKTSDKDFYHWTQWAFIQLFHSYYDTQLNQAQPISKLIERFEKQGGDDFTAQQWAAMTKQEQQTILMQYRLAYLADTKVNWCEALGTVLANDEVSEGLSVRGGFPVEQKVMKQWSLRISAYAQRLLEGLDKIDWKDSIKETQRNWIGRSEGAEILFNIKGLDESFIIFTTRADTVFGVTFMVLAPESEWVDKVTSAEQRPAVEAYLQNVKHRTERERIADRKVTGVFSGGYAIHPFTQQEIPIYISDYVLAGYGTGAIMAVPAHDSRDYAFAKHFNLPIIPLIEGADISENSFDAKEGTMINSDFLNGLSVKEAIAAMKKHIEQHHLGKIKVNYRLRDAIFSRQRYWGEPFPIYYKNDQPYTLPEHCLPLELPQVDNYLPTKDGQPPLGNATIWAWDEQNEKVVDKKLIDNKTVFPLELSTMPGFAGSSAYYLRYMDNHNANGLVSKQANEYWKQVNLYLGGSEHGTGHLIYARFWNMFLYDMGYVCCDEPFAKLINQGMIQGRSNFVYRLIGTKNTYISHGLIENEAYKDKVQPIHVDVNIVNNDVLDVEAFKAWSPEYKDAEFVLENGKYVCGWAVEKMSKSMYNVVNPDDIIEKYGADTLRLYEMFLGPIEISKPWDTKGIDGVHRFLRKWVNLFDNLSHESATADELKALHKLIKKITWDIENFSFNTSVAAFMIALNELSALKCNKASVLEPFAVLLSPFAPHITEEIWHTILGKKESIYNAQWPVLEEKYLVEDTVNMPVQFNGKVRFTLTIQKGLPKEEVEKIVLADAQTTNYLNSQQPKKVIVVPDRIVNIVV